MKKGGFKTLILLLIIVTFSYLVLNLPFIRHFIFSKRIIPEPEGTIKLTQRSNPLSQFLFEPVDIPYYQNQPVWVPNYLDFDFNEGEVNLYDVDSQNVHDTIVQRSIRQKYHQDLNYSSNTDSTQAISSIKSMSLPARSRRKIMDVLNTIESRNTPIINLDGETENQILEKVWSRVKGTDREMELVKQLEDCHEHGKTVCTTGVATRLLSVLYLDDPESFPKTKGILRQEMLNKAGNIREKFGDVEDNDQFKKKLMNTFEKDYQGVLTPEEIQAEVSSWIDYV